MKVVIIDCGAGNLHSVRKAFASQLPKDASLEVVTDADSLRSATHIVLPGVGAFADCMAGLKALPGMRAALEDAVLARKIPFLGICVGMQMLFERGHEHGVHAGLGWFKGEVRKIIPQDPTLRIPHMGWNQLHLSDESFVMGREKESTNDSPLTTHNFFEGVEKGAFVYFVHSYAAVQCNPDEVLATVDYGGEIVAVIGRENIVATQFHPEKSQAVGLRMIHNFLNRE